MSRMVASIARMPDRTLGVKKGLTWLRRLPALLLIPWALGMAVSTTFGGALHLLLVPAAAWVWLKLLRHKAI